MAFMKRYRGPIELDRDKGPTRSFSFASPIDLGLLSLAPSVQRSPPTLIPQLFTPTVSLTMQTFTAANTAPSARDELAAVLATVNELVVRSAGLTSSIQALQIQLPALVDRLNMEATAHMVEATARRLDRLNIHHDDPAAPTEVVWVEAVAKTPAQVEAEHAAATDSSRPWWVVYVGREPGIYTSVEEADLQIKGVPNQQYRRRASKLEALALYKQRHHDGLVAKMVEVIARAE
ncbi:hypothetical protein B0H14DRAFT_3439407 [Mycena olivaceomarginata]|nr:hypothetical protein B0H14DRAFT_3439407 [Mycena olivaceomarginata]